MQPDDTAIGDFNMQPDDTAVGDFNMQPDDTAVGDFNMQPDDTAIGDFNMPVLKPLINGCNMYYLIKEEGSCVVLILTNKRHSFMKPQTFETGFSDHHHLVYKILKLTFSKVPPKKSITVISEIFLWNTLPRTCTGILPTTILLTTRILNQFT